MASSVSGQDEPNRALWLATRDGKIKLSWPLRTTRCIPQEKFPRKPYNTSFIDQACSVKMTGYCPRSFFGVYGQDDVEVHKHARKGGHYPTILTEQTWSIKDLLYALLPGKFFLRDTAGSPERARWLHLDQNFLVLRNLAILWLMEKCTFPMEIRKQGAQSLRINMRRLNLGKRTKSFLPWGIRPYYSS